MRPIGSPSPIFLRTYDPFGSNRLRQGIQTTEFLCQTIWSHILPCPLIPEIRVFKIPLDAMQISMNEKGKRIGACLNHLMRVIPMTVPDKIQSFYIITSHRRTQEPGLPHPKNNIDPLKKRTGTMSSSSRLKKQNSPV